MRDVAGSIEVTTFDELNANAPGIDWTGVLVEDEEIVTVAVSVNKDTCNGDDVTAQVSPAGAVYDPADGQYTTCQIKGSAMTANTFYYVSHEISTNLLNKYKDEIRVFCKC